MLGLQENYSTKKVTIYHSDDNWSMDLLDLNDYGAKKH